MDSDAAKDQDDRQALALRKQRLMQVRIALAIMLTLNLVSGSSKGEMRLVAGVAAAISAIAFFVVLLHYVAHLRSESRK